jgi:imidazoleglycerol phosphate synthase glutamine amidotransferase subunit HisH
MITFFTTKIKIISCSSISSGNAQVRHNLDVLETLDVTGATSLASDLTVGAASNLFVDVSTSRVGINEATPGASLDVGGDVNIQSAVSATSKTTGALVVGGGVGIGGDVYASSTVLSGDLTVDTDTLIVNSTTDRVGINKAVPTVALDIVGDVVMTDDLTVDTDTLRVDAVTDRVGINVSAPDASLHVVGNAHVQNTTEAFSTVTGAVTIAGGLGVVANVHATQFHGDGSKLTGLVTTLEDVANNGNTMSNVIIFENETTGLVTDGKVGVSTRAPNANLHVVGNVHVVDTTESFSTVTGAVTITGGLGVVANVHATQFHGDGSKLTGLVTTLEDVANNGNTMSNVIQFTNEDTGLVTTGKIGVSTASPDANLHVVGNVHVADTTEAFSVTTGAVTITGGLGVVGNVHAAQFHGDGSQLTGLVTTLEDVANNGNTMSNVIIFENETTGLVTDGKVGVSTRAPDANLHVVGNAYVSDVVTLASGLVTNRDQVVKKTYAYSGTITAGDQPFINVNFTSNIFYSKISAQLVDGNEQLSTAILEVSGGSKNGTTPTKNISLGTMNIFGDVDNPNPWNENVLTTGNRVSLRPLGTLVNTGGGEYHMFIEYTSPTADGGVTTIDEDSTSVITFGY